MKRWAAAALALVLAGCALTPNEVRPSPPPFTYDYAPSTTTSTGGELRLATPAIGPVLNPYSNQSDSMAADVWDWYNPVLYSFDPGGQQIVPDPDYLVSAERGGDDTVRFELNPKARFNDRTPLAEGFLATWKASREPGFIGSSGYEYVTDISVAGNVVTVTFGEGYSHWTDLFQRLVHPKATLTSATPGDPQPELGAGPYAIESISPTGMTFVPNPAWWGRAPKLEWVKLAVMDETEAVEAFRAGQLDAVDATNRTAAKALADATIRKGSDINHTVLQLNRDSALLRNEQLRFAVLKAIDPKELAAFRFTDLDYTEMVPGSLMHSQWQGQVYHDLMKPLLGETGPEAAGRVLDAQGWPKWSDGVRMKDGAQLSLRVLVPGDDLLADGLRQIIGQQLTNAGIKAEVVAVSRAELPTVLAARGWDAVVRPVEGFELGLTHLCAWYCTDGRLTASEGIDDELKKAGGPLRTIDTTFDAEIAALGQYAMLPLWNGPKWIAVKPDLVNVGPSGYATPPKSMVGWK